MPVFIAFSDVPAVVSMSIRYATKREHDISIGGKSVEFVHGGEQIMIEIAVRALDRPRSRSSSLLGSPQAAGAGCERRG
jgi:hypothetical protein